MKSSQSGLTLISFLTVFIVVGFFILTTLKIVPVYLDHFKVKASLEGVNESGLAEKSPQEIKRMLQKRWENNSIEGISTDENVSIEKKDTSMTIRVAYEVEKPLIANMSILIKFDDTITVGDAN
jgi:hypothetical protein